MEMKKTWEAIVFDLDGTLADTLRDLAEAGNAALIEYGFAPHPVESYRMMVGNGIRKLMERAANPDTSPQTIDSLTAEMIRLYDRDCLRYTKAYEGMPETLAALKADGIRLFVVTNKPDAQAKKILSHLYAENTFDGIFGNDVGRKTKPDPALTLQVLSTVGAHPSRSLFVGDSNVDMFTAANAGMSGAGVTWGFRKIKELRDAGAQFILHKPAEILNTY